MRTDIFTVTVVATLALAACGPDFDEKWELKGYRVLGLEAVEPEVGPDDTVRLILHDYVAPDEPGRLTYHWSICLFSLGAVTNYACEVPEITVGRTASGLQSSGDPTALAGYGLGSGPSGATGTEASVDLGPAGLDLRARFAALPPLTLPDGTTASLERGFDVWAFVDSGLEAGHRVHTVKRIRVRDGDGPRNHNPGPVVFLVNGADEDTTVPRGAEVRLSVELPAGASEPATAADGSAVDTPSAGRPTDQVREELAFAWYTSGGTLDPPATFGDERGTVLELGGDTPGPVDVAVAVRDGRGGLAVAWHRLEVRD